MRMTCRDKATPSLHAACVAAFVLIAATPLPAQTFPLKPVRIIVSFPPGGSVDVIVRLIAPKLSESLGQQVVIDNRSGASGNIGTELAARAAPDGYTLLAHTLPFVTNSFLYSRMPYDAVKDFVPLSLLGSSPAVLAVHPSIPVRTVRDLVQHGPMFHALSMPLGQAMRKPSLSESAL